MEPEAFRAALLAFNLTQQGCGRLFDVDERTVRRWATGAAPIPRSVAIAFALMLRFGVKPEDLA